MEQKYALIDRDEDALRELVNARALSKAYRAAKAEARQYRGSMTWRDQDGRSYLVRRGAGGEHQTSLGARSPETEAMYDRFTRGKADAEERAKALKLRMELQRKLNRAHGVGRTPVVVVRTLAALEEAGLADKFIVIGTHAMYAYETAAAVLIDSKAMATQDLDLLFDVRRRAAFATTLARSQDRSLIRVLQKADPSFKVMSDQLQTAVNDAGFEIDIIRRKAKDGDPHPLHMSDDENDFWAAQIDQGERIASGRRYEQLVVATNGEMALMRTLHPLDFIRLKRELADRPGRDPAKAPKDRLQAQVAQQLWDDYLGAMERPEEEWDKDGQSSLRNRP